MLDVVCMRQVSRKPVPFVESCHGCCLIQRLLVYHLPLTLHGIQASDCNNKHKVWLQIQAGQLSSLLSVGRQEQLFGAAGFVALLIEVGR